LSETTEFHHRFQPPKGGSSRTILVLHGTGGDESSLFPIAEALDPDAAVLSVRGKILENGAARFFRRLAEGVFDLEDLNFRTHELADFVFSAASRYGFDLDNIYAAGYSNGANVAASMMFLRPEVLAGGILLRAMVPFEPEPSHRLAGKRVFVSEGKHDPLVPLDNADKLANLLRSLGADVTLHWVDLDHRIGRSEIEEAARWLSLHSM